MSAPEPVPTAERRPLRAEVAIVLIDASQPITEQDLRVLSLIIETGRALVIAFNKWDLVDEDRRYQLDKEHAERVRDTAIEAFTQLQPAWRLSKRYGRPILREGW